MKKVILITSHFPYCGGEQFLETEIKYFNNMEVLFMPKNKSDSIRRIPPHIMVDNFLLKNSFTQGKIIYLLKSLKRKIFYKELFSENFFNIKKLKIFLSSIYIYQMYYELFDRYLSKVQELQNIVIYTYWNDEATYALQSLKSKYHYTLISRIHGGDLYKESRSYNYMPLKKHFTTNIDVLYTITESANDYLMQTYGFDKRILMLSRLGVDLRNIIAKCSPNNSFNIVSCSFLTEVKRVDKLIRSLKILATKMKNIDFNWIHIGDGMLYESLVTLARNELNNLDNVHYDFVGNYTNEEVYSFYKKNEVDVFVNTSLSEGVPVSIMEAMSCHIPIVAPNVGGISDMIDNKKSGYLLSEECCIDELVNALSDIEFFKTKKVRESAYSIVLDKYDASKNYKNFVEDINYIANDRAVTRNTL